MTTLLKRDMRLLDIGNELILMVTEHLSSEEKMKVTDIFPKTGDQVSKFTINLRNPDEVYETIHLLKRLRNVRSLILSTSRWDWDCGDFAVFEKVIESFLVEVATFNPNIEVFENVFIHYVIAYIKRVKELDPTYDASCIREVFNLESVGGLLKTHPDLRLKLWARMSCSADEDAFEKQGARHLIHHLEKRNGSSFWDKSIRFRLHRPLPSAAILTFSVDEGSSIVNLRSNLKFLPNINHIKIQSLDTYSPDYRWTEKDFEAFQEIMANPILKHLTINVGGENLMRIVQTFISCPRNDFQSFAISNDLVLQLKVEKNWTTINHLSVKVSLADLFNKFKHIEGITIEGDDPDIVQQVQREFDIIVSNLPRNRSVVLNILKKKTLTAT